MLKKIFCGVLAALAVLSLAAFASGAAGGGSGGSASVPSTGVAAVSLSEPEVVKVDDTYKVNVTITNPTQSAIFRVALYDGDKMTGFDTQKLEAAQSEASAEIKAASADKVKVFLWDSTDNLKSLCSAREKDLSAGVDLTLTQSWVLSGGTYKNITVASSVGNGEVSLNGVTITGNLNVYGGGSNSIKLSSCTVDGKILMAKEPGSNVPRLLLTNTPVSKIEVSRDALIETTDSASVIEEIDTVVGITVQGESALVKKVNVSSESTGTVVIGGSGVINEVVAKAPVMVMSDTIKKVEIPADATQKISVNVMVDTQIEIEVNSSNGAEITADIPGTEVSVSTELDTAPEVTLGGEKIEHIHKWNEGTVISEPTYAVEGSKKFTCTDTACGETKTETLPKLSGKDFYKFVENYNGSPLRISWDASSLATDGNYYLKFNSSTTTTIRTSKTVTGLAPALLEEALPANLSLAMYIGSDLNNLTPLYPSKDIGSITVTPEVPEFTIEKDASGNYNFVSDMTGGMWLYKLYDDDGLYYTDNDLSGAINPYAPQKLADGDIVKARYLTWTLSEDKTFANLTVTSIKEYTYTEEASNPGYYFTYNDYGLFVNWPEYALAEDEMYFVTTSGSEQAYSTAQNSKIVVSALLAGKTEGEKTSIAVNKGTGFNSFSEIYNQYEIATVTVSGETPDYTISKDADEKLKFSFDFTQGMLIYCLYDKDNYLIYSGGTTDGNTKAPLSDGCTVKAQVMTWTLSADNTYANINITTPKSVTYTEQAEEDTNDAQITLTQNGGDIYALWESTGAPNYYFKIIDADEKYITSGWSNGDETKTPVSLETYIPKPDQNASYTLVVYDADADWNIGDEIGRLENCFNITISGTKVEYDIAFNAEEDGEHNITLKGDTLPTGLKLIDCWYDAAGALRSNGSSSITKNTTENEAIQNGWVYDLRVLTTFTLDGQSIKAVMTPPSKTTYVNENEPKLKWNGSGAISWQAVTNADDYKINLYSGNEVNSANLVATSNTWTTNTVGYVDNLFDIAALAEYKNATFTVEVIALDANDAVLETVGTLPGGISFTFTDTAPTYDIEVTGEKDYKIIFAEGTPDGMRYVQWYSASQQKNEGRKGFGMTGLEYNYTRDYAFTDGDKLDVYIRTTDTVTDTVWTVVTTPIKSKTYTAATTESKAYLEMEGDDLNLKVEDKEGLGTDQWYYYYQNDAMLTSDSLNYIELTWYLKNVTESTSFSYEVKKGTYAAQESLATLENAINVTVTADTPSISVTAQADGSYKFTSGGTTGYYYVVKTPNGDSINSGYTSDGTLLCGLYEGCTIDVRECTITVADDALSADVIMSASVTLSDITLAVSSAEEVEVDTLAKLQSAVDAGKVASLTADISSDSRIYFKTGAPATIKLNGYTITAPNLHIGAGKELTIDGTSAGSNVKGRLFANWYAKVSLKGGDYEYIQMYKVRGFEADNITACSDAANYVLSANQCGSITVKNSTFENVAALSYHNAIYMYDNDSVVLEGVNASAIGEYSHGAYIYNCDSATITGGTYSSAKDDGLRIDGGKASITNAGVDSGASSESTAFMAQNGAQVTIDGGTYMTPWSTALGLEDADTSVTINGGTFESTSSQATRQIAYINNAATLLTINGGTFKNFTALSSNPERAKVCGGTFSFDPSASVDADTYTVDANADGTYTVAEKQAQE